MVELHVHLDGAIKPSTCLCLYHQLHLPLPEKRLEDFSKLIIADPKAKNLGEVLKAFDYTDAVIQKEWTLKLVTDELVHDLYEQGVDYAEIRFAPVLSTREGLSQAQVIDAVIAGVEQAKASCPGIEIGLLLCLMRSDLVSEEENMETVRLAIEAKGSIVCGLDLAGDEARFPLSRYEKLFRAANEANIPYTIHAGEVDAPENVRLAIELGAKRLGHATSMAKYPDLMALARDRQVMVECCLTSNFGTKEIASLKDHAIRKFMDYGIPVCLNTDDPVLFQTSMRLEYKLAKELFHFSEKEKRRMGEEAYSYRFYNNPRWE